MKKLFYRFMRKGANIKKRFALKIRFKLGVRVNARVEKWADKKLKQLK